MWDERLAIPYPRRGRNENGTPGKRGSDNSVASAKRRPPFTNGIAVFPVFPKGGGKTVFPGIFRAIIPRIVAAHKGGLYGDRPAELYRLRLNFFEVRRRHHRTIRSSFAVTGRLRRGTSRASGRARPSPRRRAALPPNAPPGSPPGGGRRTTGRRPCTRPSAA